MRYRVKIAKGLSYNIGNTNINAKKEKYLKEMTEGKLYITDKNIIHNGNEKVTKIALNKILDYGLGEKGFVIKKDTGKPIVLPFNELGADLVSTVLDKTFDE